MQMQIGMAREATLQIWILFAHRRRLCRWPSRVWPLYSTLTIYLVVVCVCLCFDGLLARSPHLHFLLDEIFQKALQHLFYLPRLSRWYVSSILVYFICFFVVCFLVGHYIVLQRCAIYGGIGLARPSKMSGIKSLKPPRSRSRTTTPSRLLDM